ncbi:MAG: serine/threonine-protein kinase [Acidobacteria bacterium]|nr:serine/threonine-protein kinase [Acidobacteriota bacterium]
MSLTPGTRLGPYEVTALIGEGGMGQVYRARDTTLHRDVALKILPDSFAADEDRLARFTREAQTLAALSHPNIAQIYGLEESRGVRALVMELVDGDDLSQRIARGAIPLDEALPIARQLAEALEAAHEQGIIHRDLKPANIKVRADGTVKVLDFGLAKTLEQGTGIGERGSGDAGNTPTITSPAQTMRGVILGTAAYMSPEQARGTPLDRRTDVWAFGCVFYEMLTGRRAFGGGDASETIAAVLRDSPDWAHLPSTTHGALRRLLRRCLVKRADHRLAHIADAKLELDEAQAEPEFARRSTSGGSNLARMVAVGLVCALAGAALAAAIVWPRKDGAPPSVSRFVVSAAEGEVLTNDLAVSPDGRTIVHRAEQAGRARLFRRDLSELDETAIDGTDGAENVFFSSDGRWIGFWAGGAMKKISVSGGPPVEIGVTPRPYGASWGADDTILFGSITPAGALYRLPASGGQPEVVLEPGFPDTENRTILWPSRLPDRRGLLITFSRGPGMENKWIAVVPPEGSAPRELLPGASARYVPTGHILFARESALWAAPFDLKRLEVTGEARPVASGLSQTESTGAAGFDVSQDGLLVYRGTGETAADLLRPVWVTRRGEEQALTVESGSYRQVRISPDGRSAAFGSVDGGGDIWVWHFERQVMDRVTAFAGQDSRPVWSPDGRRVFHSSRRRALPEVYSVPSSGGEARLELGSEQGVPLRVGLVPTSVSPDGRWLVAHEDNVGSHRLRIVPIGEGAADRAERAIDSTSNERFGVVSPDGRLIAYESDQQAPGRQYDIYVRPFPDVDRERQLVSSGGGRMPVWGPDGRELFFVSGNTLMRVPIDPSADGFATGAPNRLFEGDYYFDTDSFTFDIAPDGTRFLMLKRVGAAAPTAEGQRLVVVLNWTDELNAKAPIP